MHKLNDDRSGNHIELEGAALIIGAGGHLMSSLALGVAQAGALAICADRNLEDAERTAEVIRVNGFKAIAINVDITNKNNVLELRREIEKNNLIVNYLINGAGINAPTPFMNIEEDEWLRIFQIQLFGVALCCQIFGEGMLAREHGSIINISSASAGPPLSKAFAYSCSKAALLNLTKNLGREWGTKGVRVNAIRPGFFPTEWNRIHFIDAEREEAILRHTPMHRFGDPAELVTAALWLLSNKSSFVTAAEIPIDGGFSGMTI
jgi:NAD(P)-dependent dehydrogenase (short-subunit alcohol dehydrogenase family)